MAPDHFSLAVLIVSYGNPEEVDRCLKSLARSDYERFDVFVCENAGAEAFAQLTATIADQGTTSELDSDSSDPLDQPSRRLVSVEKFRFSHRPNTVRVALAAENLGYGGGVNAWLERLLDRPSWNAVLVLNPDTEVDQTCLSELMAKATEGFGMVGATLVFADTPDRIISYGLRWSRTTGRVIAVGRDAPAGRAPATEVLASLDAISGACVLVTRAFIEDVGLMVEDYFLYMEDLDWGRRRGMHRIGFAEKAVVRHIGGTAIGSAVDPRKHSYLSVYLSARNSILYARRWAGWRWVLHFGVGLLYATRYILLGARPAAKIMLIGLLDGVRGRTGRPHTSFGS